MPIDKSRYPPNWDQIALRVKQEADWTCEHCGKRCCTPGQPCPDRRFVLTVHHIDHDPANNARDNLIALCAPCHLAADAAHHARNAMITRAAKKGQRWLPGLKGVY